MDSLASSSSYLKPTAPLNRDNKPYIPIILKETFTLGDTYPH